MGNAKLEKLMIEKFRIDNIQAVVLGEKINTYVKDFEKCNLYHELSKYLNP